MNFVLIGFDAGGVDLTAIVDALQARFGAVTVTALEFTPPIVIVPAPPVVHNFRPRTNQEVLNLFRSIFGQVEYWGIVERAGLAWLAANRNAAYSGMDVEALPLSGDEKSRLVAAL